MARTFNGTTDVIRADAARLFSTSSACSFSFWAKGVTTVASLYAEAATASTNNVFSLGGDATNGAHLRLFVKAVTTVLDVTGTATAFDTYWHHCCYTQDASRNYTSYIDGAVDLSGTYGAATVTPTDLSFGALVRSSSSGFYSGTIAEVANWSRTLSAAEALQLTLGVPASYLTADNYWPLAGTASPEPDIGTASPTNGTLTGTGSAAGPPIVGLAQFIPSLGRRPVPMIQGPDKDRILSMRGNSF
jgi:hypothetical protein